MLLDGYQVLLKELRCNAPSEMSKGKVTSLPGSLCPVHEPLQEMTAEAATSASPLTRHLGHTQAAHPIPQQLQLCPNLSPKGSSPTVRDQTVVSSGLSVWALLHVSEDKPRLQPAFSCTCVFMSVSCIGAAPANAPTISALLSMAVSSCMWLLRNASETGLKP